ncbi:MAG: hypothetical protein VXW87_00940 [Pseudomonadota bacterium]|nr:hypothetical protein [Pseudomonadota bacterium]
MLHVYSATGNIIGLIETKSLPKPEEPVVYKDILTTHSIDQLIFYHPSTLRLIIFNRDGSVAKNCGNGLRALGHHLGQTNIEADFKLEILPHKKPVLIQNIYSETTLTTWVQVGQPYIQKHTHTIQSPPYTLLSVGNDHLIVWNHPICNNLIKAFNTEYNISFAYTLPQIYSNSNTPTRLYLRTYERGVGWTAACGSAAACLTTLANHLIARDQCKWEVHTLGGILKNKITPKGIFQTGSIKKLSSLSL